MDALQALNKELPKYGAKVMLAYGGGSIKKNGIYEQVMNLLESNGKTVIEDSGVLPMSGGYKVLDKNEIMQILRESM